MDILDIFYNYVVKEASKGSINCFFNYSIFFETYFMESGERISSSKEEKLIPILTIHNKKEFDKLLCKYVDLCMLFYGTSNFCEEVLNNENYEIDRTSPEKLIILTLWANATYDDFLNPEEYLRKRISFLENSEEISFDTEYSNLLKGRISFKIEKDKLVFETPYKICIKLINSDNLEYIFPEVKFGIYNNQVYFYAIQDISKDNNSYSKKINRLLYKIGEGFNEKEDNFELYEEGNLKDVTSSFVVALNMAISYFHSLGYTNIVVPNMLPIRWNSKITVSERKYNLNKIDEKEYESQKEKIIDIQKNLTEKFIRTFLRLQYHYEGMNVESLPMELDSCLHISLEDTLNSNNELLNETRSLIKESIVSRHI